MDDRFTADGRTADKRSTEGGRLNLAVIGDGFVASHPLPEPGCIVIGRGADADVRIDHESVSRRHARITISSRAGSSAGGSSGAGAIGETLELEDLGSSNGTTCNNQPVEAGQRIEFAPGEMIEIGAVMIVVQRQAVAARTRRVWSHDAFESRVEEECERGKGRTFAVLRLRSRKLAQATLQDTVLDHVRPQDLVAWYGPTDVEILALDTPVEAAEQLLATLRDTLVRRGGKVDAALASYPRDGKSADVLIGRACNRLQGADDQQPLISESPAMHGLQRMLQRVASGTINVLLLGETGAGKEVIADQIHHLSPRAQQPLLKLNCATFNDSLLESELFGHERGAFTGAVDTKPGLLETASGGTVFLDEIGDLPLGLQAKLLRVIEERRVMRVGGLESRPIDVRFVAATHRDLEAAVASQTFRHDLFYRLNGITLVIPPLRERVEDIVPLARAFVERGARALGLERAPAVTQEALTLLRSYPWPGNVRELRNVIERAVLLAGAGGIAPEHLPFEKMNAAGVAPLRAGVMERERALILDALDRTDGNQTEAAKLLGISRRTLVSRISEYGLPRPRKK
jgi:two-component system, NtrC family, response regulator AtoC